MSSTWPEQNFLRQRAVSRKMTKYKDFGHRSSLCIACAPRTVTQLHLLPPSSWPFAQGEDCAWWPSLALAVWRISPTVYVSCACISVCLLGISLNITVWKQLAISPNSFLTFTGHQNIIGSFRTGQNFTAKPSSIWSCLAYRSNEDLWSFVVFKEILSETKWATLLGGFHSL